MACTIQAFGFEINGNYPTTTSCNAYNTDTIDAEADVTFTSDLVGQQVYCYIILQLPSGSPPTQGFYTNNGNPETVVGGVNSFYVHNIIQKNTSLLGTYKIAAVHILNSTKNTEYCYQTTQPTCCCTSLTLSAVPVTCSVSGYWLVNGNPISGVNCTAGTSDTIDVRCVGTFSSNASGKQFKAGMQIRKPDSTFVSKLTSFETVSGTTHNFTIPLTSFTSISPGLYSTGAAGSFSFIILDTTNATICQGTGTGSGNCENLTIVSCSVPAVTINCPSTITQGATGSIAASIGTIVGTPPYVYKLYSDDILIDTYPTSGTTTSTSHTFSHTFSESVTSHIFRVDVVDSCPGGSQTGSDSCTVTIQSGGICTAPVISVSCASSIPQNSTGNIVAHMTTTGTPPYTYKLYIDSGNVSVATYGPTNNTSYTFLHLFSETIGAHTYKVEVTDSCSTGGLTGMDICSSNITQPGAAVGGIGPIIIIGAVGGVALLYLLTRPKTPKTP